MKNLKHNSNVWAQVRNLEQQLRPTFPFSRLKFESAGKDKDDDNVFMVGYELWKESRVFNELIPYLRTLLAKQKRRFHIDRWRCEYARIQAQYVTTPTPMSVHDPVWKFQIGPRYNHLRTLVAKSANV